MTAGPTAMPPPHLLPEDLRPDPGESRVYRAEFALGEVVYLKLRDNEVPGHVTELAFHPGAAPLYGVAWGDGEFTRHYGLELAREFAPRY